ncbi:MAG: hypothetical protein KAI47_09680 [Deltaproteobacteria bacterium]|nr:hypothetical protein [Deltaproteobacteria bacterium]
MSSLVACQPSVAPLTHPSTQMAQSRQQPLPLPPTVATHRRLLRLAKDATCEAHWHRARLLLDLYDVACFLRGEVDRVSKDERVLREAVESFVDRELALPETALSDDARRRALRRLLLRVQPPCRFDRAARRAERLLAADAWPRTSHVERMKVAIAYKKIAFASGDLEMNARFRLADWCLDAFREATRRPPSQQQAHLNQCLYALYEADPGPYFAKDPGLRPPDPPWTVLRQDLNRSLDWLAHTRAGKIAVLQRSFDDTFFVTAQAELPSALNLRRLNLPSSDQGLPYDRTPIVTFTPAGFLVDGLVVPKDDPELLKKALARRLEGDQRATITVVAAPKTSLGGLFDIGRVARKLKVATLLLGVRRRVAAAAPGGDVQARIAGVGAAVWRLEGIPLSVRLLALHPGGPARDRPRQLLYDPRAIHARLAVTYKPGAGIVFSSRHGRFPTHILGAAFRNALALLRRLYPQEPALIVGPTRATSYGPFVSLIQRLRYRERRPLFPSVALSSFHRVTAPDLNLRRYARWVLGAKVHIDPDDGLSLALRQSLRRCYREGLERAHLQGKAAPASTLEIWKRGRRPRHAFRDLASRLGDKKMASCILAVLPKKPTVPRLNLTFQVPPEPTSAPPSVPVSP